MPLAAPPTGVQRWPPTGQLTLTGTKRSLGEATSGARNWALFEV
jgi:hypothetical protein